MLSHRFLPFAAALLVCTGCATYTTPGRAADLTLFADDVELSEDGVARTASSELEDIFAREPLAEFPATLALVRVQAPGYRSHSMKHGGVEAPTFSVMTTRDVETEDDLERLAAMPGVAAVAPFNRLLLGGPLSSDMDLRKAAARLRADVLLLYTFDTTFHTDDDVNPLSVLSLGMLSTQDVGVTTTAAALLIDVRSGFVYGLAEATDDAAGKSNAYRTRAAIDELRRATERQAFEELVGEVETAWREVNARFGAAQ